MTVHKKLLIKLKKINQIWRSWCCFNEEKMFYPAKWKKITVDQSKVLKNRMFRLFGATWYKEVLRSIWSQFEHNQLTSHTNDSEREIGIFIWRMISSKHVIHLNDFRQTVHGLRKKKAKHGKKWPTARLGYRLRETCTVKNCCKNLQYFTGNSAAQ